MKASLRAIPIPQIGKEITNINVGIPVAQLAVGAAINHPRQALRTIVKTARVFSAKSTMRFNVYDPHHPAQPTIDWPLPMKKIVQKNKKG